MGIMDHHLFKGEFSFQNQILSYNQIPKYDTAGTTIYNFAERAVEIPLALHFLSVHGIGKKILEVGNVLRHYSVLLQQIPRLGPLDTIDKFEAYPDVMNIDIMDVNTKYEVIISISTVEHVGQNGYGEHEIGDREAPLKAIVQIYNLLKTGGKAFITVPFGKLMDLGWLIQFSSNYLDLLVDKYGIPAQAIQTYFMKKIDTEATIEGPRQLWQQCERSELEHTYFHYPFAFAGGIAVIELSKIDKDIEPSDTLSTSLHYHAPVKIGDLYFSGMTLPKGQDRDGWITCLSTGYVFYGPYVTLEPQSYSLDMDIEIRGQGLFTLELTADFGQTILWSQRNIVRSENIHNILHVTTTESNVEVRLHKHGLSNSQVRVPKLLLSALEQ
ncbi:hypothetical protein BVG16_05480 [Paenibacillus selenitireducens]|uniref:Methyltransferase type 11 domain-containing protein n=1 Tax=Paenibacillus selenitireducens TaxID=1324314 RepID=A0A1T2XK43_9BACL|nr:hypothetical protein [Paenibacillus selenitireducens]OPA80195.1 hypothetical protein BVG16_05480 [Paenibacillus selenitireducens]